MSEKEEKLIIVAPVRLHREAVSAFDFAYHNSDFSGGFAVIEKFPRVWVIKKNRAGYSVRMGGGEGY